MLVSNDFSCKVCWKRLNQTVQKPQRWLTALGEGLLYHGNWVFHFICYLDSFKTSAWLGEERPCRSQPGLMETWCGDNLAAVMWTVSAVVIAWLIALVSVVFFADFAGLVATEVDMSVVHHFQYKTASPAFHPEQTFPMARGTSRLLMLPQSVDFRM